MLRTRTVLLAIPRNTDFDWGCIRGLHHKSVSALNRLAVFLINRCELSHLLNFLLIANATTKAERHDVQQHGSRQDAENPTPLVTASKLIRSTDVAAKLRSTRSTACDARKNRKERNLFIFLGAGNKMRFAFVYFDSEYLRHKDRSGARWCC
jgi:hypothetical protein